MNAILYKNDIVIFHKISEDDAILVNGLETKINLSDENITDSIFVKGILRFFSTIKNLPEKKKIKLNYDKAYFTFFESPNTKILKKYYKNEGIGIVNLLNGYREDYLIEGIIFLNQSQFKKLKEMSIIFMGNDKLVLNFNFYFVFETEFSISKFFEKNEINLCVKELEFSLSKNNN